MTDRDASENLASQAVNQAEGKPAGSHEHQKYAKTGEKNQQIGY